jgi:transposase
MFHVYGKKCLSRKTVHNWVEKLSQGRSKVADDTRPGRPVEIATEATVKHVKELIRADRRITIDSVTTALGCSHCLAYSIMHDRLKYRTECAQWVPRKPKDREKNKPNASVLATLLRYADEGEHMLNRNVTGNEPWVHHYQPESKHALMQWKHPSSSSRTTKKFKNEKYSVKCDQYIYHFSVHLTCFDPKGSSSEVH